ncbi:MAG TPA: Xaa-Pro peptidase family protein [Sedimentisphaerales bacterium]|nr:Xaa-Pro peptidase family protein [Sedimentisphaerales bacterium]
MNRRIVSQRTAAIRRRLKRRRISCLIVTSPANVTYTTGFTGADSWAAITAARTYLLTDSRYIEQAQKECPSSTIVQRTATMAQAVAGLVARLKSVRAVTVEKSVSLDDFEALKKQLKSRPKSAGGIIERIRSVKDPDEIAAIKASADIATKVLERTMSKVNAGMAEIELAGLLDFQLRKAGATNSFDTIVAFGPNASRPHHQPGGRRLRKKDTILIDFGARYKGYCSDITRCFVLGEPAAFYRKVFNVVERAQAAAIKAIAPGVKLTTVDSAARDVIRAADLPVYGHGTGHGLGLEIHELPFLKADSKAEKLKPGQVITIEPGVYIPGKLGVRIEDDFLITENGCEILTRNCPHSYQLSR